MTTSSEDVLLSMGHVRYKKRNGTLFVMKQRISWMLENKKTVAVSYKYADVNCLKATASGNPKVLLQVVLHDGTISTFKFLNPGGLEAQESDRYKCIIVLHHLLPKFKRKIDVELEMKSRLLSQHPNLKHLYEDLVITKVINSEEYWKTATLKSYTESITEQEAGVSGAFLADLHPIPFGNGFTYNLTQDIIDAIFKTYPAVNKKFIDHVPHKMTESEFWTLFVQSHYFHRDRISSSSKDFFGQCAKIDDNAIASAMRHTIVDSTVDIPNFTEPVPFIPVDDEQTKETDRDEITSINRIMIKRFNQYSIMILQASQKTNSSGNDIKSIKDKNDNYETHNNVKIVENGVNSLRGSDEKSPTEEKSSEEPPEKRKCVLEKIHFEDLDNDIKKDDLPELKLSKIDGYLLGPSGLTTQPVVPPSCPPPPLEALASICEAWSDGQQSQRPLDLSCSATMLTLLEPSPGGALMRQHHSASMPQSIPADVKSELRRLYMAGQELLRELWSCFPKPGSMAGAKKNIAKAEEFYQALLRFKDIKLRPFEEKMLRDFTPLASSLTRQINQMIDAACSKYVGWQQRQAKLR